MDAFDPASAITAEATAQGVDPDLANAIAMNGEGNGHYLSNTAVSPAGAHGIMQLMPHTAAALGVDPTDPAQNIHGGVKYIKQLSDQFGGDPTKVAAAYNAGPGAVVTHGGVPPYKETQGYVDRVTGALTPSQDELQAAYQAQTNGAAPPAAPTSAAPGSVSVTDVHTTTPEELAAAKAEGSDDVTPPDDELQSAFAKAHPDLVQAPPTPALPVTGLGLAKSLGSGALQGIAGMADMAGTAMGDPSAAANVGTGAGTWIAQHLGLMSPQDANRQTTNARAMFGPDASQSLQGSGILHAPQNFPEQAANTVGAFLPGAMFGPAGDTSALANLGVRAANVAVPSALSLGGGEGAKALGIGPEGQQIASTVGGIAGGLLAGGMHGSPTPTEATGGISPTAPVPPSVAAQAAQYVASKMGGVDQKMVDAAQSGKPVLTAEMLGNPGKVALKAVALKSPGVANDLQQTIGDRASSLQSNYADAFGKAAGVDPDAAKGDFDTQIASARANMKPQYAAIMSSPEPVMTPDLAEISQRPAVQSAMRMAATSLRNAGKDPAAVGLKIDPATGNVMMGTPPSAPSATTLLGGDAMQLSPAIQAQLQAKGVLPAPEAMTESQPTLEAWDLTKKAMQDQVKRDPFGRVITTGQEGRFNGDTNTAARDLTGALRDASPAYGDVLDQAGDYMRQQKAFEAGQSHLFDPKTSVNDGQAYFEGLSEPEQGAYRAGMASKVYDQAQNNLLTPRVLAKPIVQGKLDYALPQGADDFLQDVGHYSAMNANNARMSPSVGSETTPLKEEIGAQDSAGRGTLGSALGNFAGDFVKGTGATALTGHMSPTLGLGYAGMNAARGGVSKLSDMVSNAQMPQAVRDEVGRILMSHMTPDQLRAYIDSTKQIAGINASPLAAPASGAAIGGYMGANANGVNERPHALAGVR